MARSKTASEGKATVYLGEEGVFYNPEMRFCRSFFSLAVGAAAESEKKRLSIVDATAASGIRGMRYKLENKGVGKLWLVDVNEKAAKLAEKNVKLNKMKNTEVVKGDVNKFFHEKNEMRFIELDPFGTPLPLLFDAIRFARGGAFLSVTATDVAVLCGAHAKACVKNYSAKPVNNEFCHENAVRILLGKIARTAAENGFGITPLVSLSRQHFVKVLVRLDEGADKAVGSVQDCGFLWYCRACLQHGFKKGVVPELSRECPDCGKGVEFGGPLWLGELHEEKFLQRMLELNSARGYEDREKIASSLELMKGEVGLPPFYYNLHRVCKRLRKPAQKTALILERLRKKGFKVVLTHFQPNCIKTDAPLEEVRKAVS